MDGKRVLGLALASVALALVVWGLMTAKVSVEIKDARQAKVEDFIPSIQVEPKPVHVYLNRDGSLRVGDKRSSLDLLVGDIVDQASSPDKTLQRIVLHENVDVPFDVYKAVMSRINAAGWRRIELETQRGDPK